MPKNKENLKSLPLVEKDRPSRFVVDLKAFHTQEEEDKTLRKTLFFYKNKFSFSFPRFNFKRPSLFCNTKKKRLNIKFSLPLRNKNFFSGFFKNRKNWQDLVVKQTFKFDFLEKLSAFQEKFLRALAFFENKKSQAGSFRLDKLAFFGVVKIAIWSVLAVFRIFYKICFRLGWIILFIVRFVYFFFQRIFLFFGHKFLLIRKALAIGQNFANFILFILFSFTGLLIRIFKNIFLFFTNLFRIIIGFPQRYVLSFFRKLRYQVERIRKIIFKKRKIGLKKYFPETSSWNFGWVSRKISLPANHRVRTKKSFSFSFAIFLFFISIPFAALSYYKTLTITENNILGVAEAAVSDLGGAVSSITNLDFSRARNDFSQAGFNFLQAEKQLSEVNKTLFTLAGFSDNKKMQLASQAEQVIAAGQAAASLGENISAALDSLFTSSGKETLDIIKDFTYYGRLAQIDAEKLNDLLADINFEILPAEYQEQFLSLKEKSSYLSSGLSEFLAIAENLNYFLGESEDKRYLLIFQNNTELRATGGFIGSYALVDFKKGKINNLEVPAGGGYDTEGGLRERIISPEPLHLIQPLWHFWDANWSPDWPTSAEKIMWFYEKSGGPTVDGVISFTPTVLEKILEIMGSIDMSEEYGVIIDHENFWLTVQDIVEAKPTSTVDFLVEENKPKKIIGDMMEKIISEMPSRLDREKLIKLFGALEESFAGKHILFYFIDEELQKIMDEKNWSGRIKPAESNYLAVVNTNIAGGKSDKRIKESIVHQTEITADGEIINTLQIKRTHTGIKNEQFSGVRNVDWMRIYVPWGSQLLEARGFTAPDSIYFKEADPEWNLDEDLMKIKATERIHDASGTLVYDELGKTVFANWSMVDPGESVVIYLKYKLLLPIQPKKDSWLDKIQNLFDLKRSKLYPYSLYIQKQAGAMPSEIKTSLSIMGDYDVIWNYPGDLNVNPAGWLFQGQLNEDRYQAVLLAK